MGEEAVVERRERRESRDGERGGEMEMIFVSGNVGVDGNDDGLYGYMESGRGLRGDGR